ncbi:nucleotidyltransferase [Inediibacterium massiliense]|uniref:nucleotidyltransferase n=1 Tax=Inediibacterium massiliense TaxID=1658111 RepID=UPI0006B69434|nr:nucleotidyltransferase [Inediibacterium massiliense]
MKVLGLITEYNPFHNGHIYHLLSSKKKTNSTHTIAIMSGNFLQRGEPALFNKWIRAKMAVAEGIDLVIELPVLYACNSAEFFSYGAISLLENIGIVDCLCFGSESGELSSLKKIAQILIDEPIFYQNNLKNFLSQGMSFPKARQKAIENYLKDSNIYKDLLTPNNILGIEYLKSLIKLNSTMIPYTISRIKADYHSKNIEENICSATAIREYLFHHKDCIDHLKKVMPKESFSILKENIQNQYGPIEYKNFEDLILYKLRTIPIEELIKITDVVEGLENKLKVASKRAYDLESLISLSKSKRYTQTRLQRIFVHALLGITKKDIFSFSGPQYARILAFSNNGTELLKKMKKTSKIPILTNINKQPLENTFSQKMLNFDILATDIYALGHKNISYKKAGQDYYQTPFIQ